MPYIVACAVQEISLERRYRNALQEMGAILTSIHQEIEEFGISVGDSAVDNPVSVIEKIALRFHAVARQLRTRHATRATLSVKDEYGPVSASWQR
jgi:hypothetical protein